MRTGFEEKSWNLNGRFRDFGVCIHWVEGKTCVWVHLWRKISKHDIGTRKFSNIQSSMPNGSLFLGAIKMIGNHWNQAAAKAIEENTLAAQQTPRGVLVSILHWNSIVSLTTSILSNSLARPIGHIEFTDCLDFKNDGNNSTLIVEFEYDLSPASYKATKVDWTLINWCAHSSRPPCLCVLVIITSLARMYPRPSSSSSSSSNQPASKLTPIGRQSVLFLFLCSFCSCCYFSLGRFAVSQKAKWPTQVNVYSWRKHKQAQLYSWLWTNCWELNLNKQMCRSSAAAAAAAVGQNGSTITLVALTRTDYPLHPSIRCIQPFCLTWLLAWTSWRNETLTNTLRLGQTYWQCSRTYKSFDRWKRMPPPLPSRLEVTNKKKLMEFQLKLFFSPQNSISIWVWFQSVIQHHWLRPSILMWLSSF